MEPHLLRPLAPCGEEEKYRSLVRELCDSLLTSFAKDDDATGNFRKDAFRKFAHRRIHASLLPEAIGGLALPSRIYYAGLEEISRVSVAFSVAVGVTNLVQGAIFLYGNAEQKEKFLKPLITGDFLGAFSLSEPQSGSDASALKLQATKTAGGYRLRGTKSWCSNAGYADLFLVMARTGEDKTRGISAFLVSKDTPGFSTGKEEKKMGLKASSLRELVFEDCFVPDDRLLSKEGDGFSIALSQLDSGRIAIAAAGLGASAASIEEAFRFLQTQEAPPDDGRALLLARHFAEWQALSSHLRAVADGKDRKEVLSPYAAQIKWLATDLAMKASSDALEIAQTVGYVLSSRLQRTFRDAKALQIVEGTNQIQSIVLARELKKRYQG